jgi:hypothetical protein
MARIRTVKPELFKHEILFELEVETGFPIRAAFIGLFTCCDREGRFKWRPKALKCDILPYDELDFSRVLDALVSRGFVVKYVSNNEEYGYIPSFNRHQIINNRESESILPEPNAGLVIDASSTREARDSHAPLGEGKGKEGKGRERKGKEIAQAPKFNFAKELEILGVEENAITTWLAVRKKKKAVNSEIALEALKREALKAGFSVNQAVLECCTKSWSGFSADWVGGGKKSSHNDFSSIDYTKGINDDGSF